MKTKLLFAIGAGFLHLSFCSLSWGDPQYSIPWYKIAGGGGTSTNATFSLSGTIGQADASSQMSSGNLSMTGGYWVMHALQTLGAPTLYITHTANNVTVYWQDASGWSLQQNPDVANPLNWTTRTGWTTANGTNYLSLTSPLGNMFFRLNHQ
jgi:hypothetical protein